MSRALVLDSVVVVEPVVVEPVAVVDLLLTVVVVALWLMCSSHFKKHTRA